MLKRKDRTIELYLVAGAWMRLLKHVYGRTLVELDKVFPAEKESVLFNIDRKIGKISSDVENHMFEDYPKLSNDYLSVFYGDVHVNRRDNDVDKKIHIIIEELLRDIIEKNKGVYSENEREQ